MLARSKQESNPNSYSYSKQYRIGAMVLRRILEVLMSILVEGRGWGTVELHTFPQNTTLCFGDDARLLPFSLDLYILASKPMPITLSEYMTKQRPKCICMSVCRYNSRALQKKAMPVI